MLFGKYLNRKLHNTGCFNGHKGNARGKRKEENRRSVINAPWLIQYLRTSHKALYA